MVNFGGEKRKKRWNQLCISHTPLLHQIVNLKAKLNRINHIVMTFSVNKIFLKYFFKKIFDFMGYPTKLTFENEMVWVGLDSSKCPPRPSGWGFRNPWATQPSGCPYWLNPSGISGWKYFILLQSFSFKKIKKEIP